MSTYRRLTLHPLFRTYQPAWWIDDFFSHYHYGVKFDGEPFVWDPWRIKIKTRNNWPKSFDQKTDFDHAWQDHLKFKMPPPATMQEHHENQQSSGIYIKLKK